MHLSQSILRNVSRIWVLVAIAGLTAIAGAQTVTQPGPWVGHLVDRSLRSESKPQPVVPSVRLRLDIWDQVPPVELEPIDEAALRAEDAARMTDGGPLALRNGVPRGLGDAPNAESLGWFEIPGVGRLWAAAYTSPHAEGLRLHFAAVDLPKGAELWVYSPKYITQAQGPFRGAGPFGHGRFWTTIFPGETIRIEYFLPAGVADGAFVVDELMHIYRDLYAPFTDGDGGEREGPCHPDVMCYPEWHPLHNATARIDTVVNGGNSVCTGTLLNNLAEDFSPLLLTARHCCNTQESAETAVIYWFFQTDECDGTPPPLNDVPQSAYGNLLASTGTTDFSLLVILEDLPPGLTWAGWDATEIPIGTPVAGIHHPTGAYKRIMFGDTINHPFGNPQNYWGVTWTEGTVEFSSSGSGLYRTDTQLYIGQASQSEYPPNCSNPDGPSGYGRFDRTYTYIEDYMVNGFDDVFEPNDTCAAAYALYPATYTDRVVKDTAEDWFRIGAGACDRIEISTAFAHAFGDINIELYDACSGTLVASSTSGDDNEAISYENPLGTAHDYYLRAYLVEGQLNLYSLTLDLIPDVSGPQIIEQPQDVTECVGGTAVFNITATSGNLFYQWRRGNTNLTNDDRISGARTDTLMISDLQLGDAAPDYNCLVVNSCGVAFSDNAALVVSECDCPGDLDGDGDTDQSDLGILLGDWGCSGGSCPGDLDGDGDTDQADLGILLADWNCGAGP